MASSLPLIKPLFLFLEDCSNDTWQLPPSIIIIIFFFYYYYYSIHFSFPSDDWVLHMKLQLTDFKYRYKAESNIMQTYLLNSLGYNRSKLAFK